MSLADRKWKKSYCSPEDNVVQELLIPALKEAVLYERASGYFSSDSLLEITTGIYSLVMNGGHIRMIISPNITAKDAEAIKIGYQLRREYEEIHEFLSSSFIPAKTPEEEEKYNILSHLIADGTLDIRVAVMKKKPSTGIFHDKTGIIEDKNGDMLAFSGSMNETLNGFYVNHESVDVYFSDGPDYERVMDKKERFEKYWNNEVPTIEVFEFPEDLKAKIDRYQKKTVDWSLTQIKKEEKYTPRKKRVPAIPSEITLRPYQVSAIAKWVENNYRGFFDMATGTGKTITAISAIVMLMEKARTQRKQVAVIIVVPYIHLVTQWMKDLERFNIQSIMGFSGGNNSNWRTTFQSEIRYLNARIKDYVCLITTNASFRTEKTQKIINQIRCEKLLVIDEAHNFGSETLKKQLDNRFDYRLALSATIDRPNDPETTEQLRNYFAPTCISYPLEQAINDGMLCEYEYYPVPVYLTEDELEKYEALSEKIAKLIARDADGKPKKGKNGSIKLSPEAKMLLIKRSRLIAGAENKLVKLEKIMRSLPHPDHLLVYCGATTVNTEQTEFSEPGEEEMRQIEAVSVILQDEFNIRSAQYTSEESNEERKQITRRFDKGDIEAIVAIRCLDEGVDIPSINKAIFLASSTNPKEYIQRRGRVLRKSPGKDRAILIDLITLPTDLEAGSYSNRPNDLSLVKRELKRVRDFASSCLNKAFSMEFIKALEEKYGYLSLNDWEGEIEEYE